MTNEVGGGAKNTRAGSNVDLELSAEPLAFLRPETGEVIIVPVEDAALFRSHYNGLSDLVAEMHSAHRAVQLCEEHLQELEVRGASAAEKAQSRRVHGFALDWQQEAHERLHALYERLDPVQGSGQDADAKPSEGSPRPVDLKEDEHGVSGSGKRLVELIALKHDSRKERKKKEAEDREGKVEDGTYKQKIASLKTAAGLRKLGKWPKKMPEKLVYVESGKLKPKWPKIKDVEKTKWSEVYRKGRDGKRTLNKEKLQKYVTEQVARQTTITPRTLFGEDLEGGATITLGQWADNWNQAHKYERHGSLAHGEAPIADIDLAADAQLMRFCYGGSLNGDLSVMDRRVSVKAEGHAAVDFAKAQASLDLFFPRKDGWLWTVRDIDGQQINLIAARCRITVEASVAVSASIAAELAMKVEISPVDGKPKVRGKRGRKGKAARRKQTVSLNTNDEADVGTLDASVAAFAGARANASLEGALEWRDPEHPDKEFAVIASVAPTVGGMAGVGAEAKFKIEYTSGTFRLSAHAALCVGLGAEGAVEFEVGTEQMGAFFRCLFYNIAYWQFRNLQIIKDDAFAAFKGIQFLAVQTGREIGSYYGDILDKINQTVADVDLRMAQAQARQDLANRILNNPASLAYATPEAKGMLIYQLTRHGGADVVVAGGAAAGDNYLGRQRKAVLAIIKTATSKAESRNIIQHIDVNGAKEKKDGVNFQKLREFFRTEAIGDIDLPFYQSPFLKQFNDAWDQLALNGDFEGWYQAFSDHLMDAVPHGHTLMAATSPAYDAQRGMADHPLFASSGWHAYYTDEA